MLAANVHPKVVQERLGHSSIMVTMDIYSHVLVGLQREAARALDQVLARAEWQDPDIAEGLMLEQGGALVCGTMSNVFIVRNGTLLTPEITLCGVSGIMRRHILALANNNGLRAEVSRIQADVIHTADEMFLCNSQFGIWPVSRCGRKSFVEWPLTRKIMTLLRQSGVIEGPE